MQKYKNVVSILGTIISEWIKSLVFALLLQPRCFVWVWNLVVDIAGGKEEEGVWEYGIEENIWT